MRVDELGITPTLEKARPIQAALAIGRHGFILGAAIPLIVVALVPAAREVLLMARSPGVVAAGASDHVSGRWLRGRAAREWRSPASPYGSPSGARWLMGVVPAGAGALFGTVV